MLAPFFQDTVTRRLRAEINCLVNAPFTALRQGAESAISRLQRTHRWFGALPEGWIQEGVLNPVRFGRFRGSQVRRQIPLRVSQGGCGSAVSVFYRHPPKGAVAVKDVAVGLKPEVERNSGNCHPIS